MIIPNLYMVFTHFKAGFKPFNDCLRQIKGKFMLIFIKLSPAAG